MAIPAHAPVFSSEDGCDRAAFAAGRAAVAETGSTLISSTAAPLPVPFPTTTVPVMPGWSRHVYEYTPGSLNLKVMVVDGAASLWPLPQPPPAPVTVWASGSLFTQVTSDPMSVRRTVGVKQFLPIVTVVPDPSVTFPSWQKPPACAGTPGRNANTAAAARTARTALVMDISSSFRQCLYNRRDSTVPTFIAGRPRSGGRTACRYRPP